MSAVIFSNDKFLLCRISTELQMIGYEIDEEWCEYYNPLANDYVRWLWIGGRIQVFHNHKCLTPDLRIWLTKNNYSMWIKKIQSLCV